jgi:ubiquinone/menaquinone biosynthesis C-methylase UbiE
MGNRGIYKDVWNALSADEGSALRHVGGTEDEAAIDHETGNTLGVIARTIGIRPEDTFLEIGCGVGRVGKQLAPRVRRWIGCDVAENMLGHARKRLGHMANVDLVPIGGTDLAPIPDASVDAVYATVVFMHLDEWDRWAYVREAFRVLRPGGRFWCDNVDIRTEDGWKLFLHVAGAFTPGQRPAHISRCSTPEELRTYLERAGFHGVRTCERHLWVDAWGVKPG